MLRLSFPSLMMHLYPRAWPAFLPEGAGDGAPERSQRCCTAPSPSKRKIVLKKLPAHSLKEFSLPARSRAGSATASGALVSSKATAPVGHQPTTATTHRPRPYRGGERRPYGGREGPSLGRVACRDLGSRWCGGVRPGGEALTAH